MKKLVFLFFIFIISCQTPENVKVVSVKPEFKGQISAGKWNSGFSVKISESEKVDLFIYFPAKFEIGKAYKTVILLHDFDQDNKEWSRNSRAAKFAEQYSLVLVCPQMKNTIYEKEFYPETVNKWSSVPGAVFIGDYLIPYLSRNLGLAASRQLTSIMGIGNGAQGAFKTASLYSEKISGAAVFSGYYDYLMMTKDRKITAVLGEYSKFKERWESESALTFADKLADSKLIIIHGGKDGYYPITYSMMIAIKMNSMGKANPGKYKNKYYNKAVGKHDWAFWNTQFELVFEFLFTEL